MRFLCISDIHGHVAALEAVLAEGRVRAAEQLLVAGDLLFPGPAPLDTWRLLLAEKAVAVQGLGDRALAQVDPTKLRAKDPAQAARIAQLAATRAALGELILARLAKLPTVARLPLENGNELVLVHGSPADPTEPFTADMTDDELSALVGDDPADIIVAGGSHVPFHRQLDGVHIVGVGSVGEAPSGEVAHATLIDAGPLGVSLEQFEVPLPR
ncbi:MAG: metallophosphoesterase family protein [Deltaproteobacteria bacterium]|nr:metallophosphoesterase family protein [Deltaproteobacteria bacterium]